MNNRWDRKEEDDESNNEQKTIIPYKIHTIEKNVAATVECWFSLFVIIY